MTWVRVDDSAPHHPKLIEAGPEAAWLWIAGLCHCNAFATDGLIRRLLLPSLYPSGWSRLKVERLADRLVTVKLWRKFNGDFMVNDYESYQAPALKLASDARKAAERERKARWRAAKALDKVSGVTAVSQRDTRDTETRESALPDPTRPVPTRPIITSSSEDSEAIDSPPLPPVPGGARREAFGLLVRGYQARYEREARDAWQSIDANRRQIDQVAVYLATHENMPAVCADLLDGFFANPWAKQNRWPWRALAKDPAGFRSSRQADPGGDEAERKRLRAEALRAESLAEHERALARIRAECEPEGP